MQAHAQPDAAGNRSARDTTARREEEAIAIDIRGESQSFRVNYVDNLQHHRPIVIGATKLGTLDANPLRALVPNPLRKYYVSLSVGEGVDEETKSTRKAPGKNPQWNETLSL